MNKTNAMRLLDTHKIVYKVFEYDEKKAVSAQEVAAFLNEPAEKVFKTLVTIGKSKNHYVFVLPATSELDLKKAAVASDEKNIEMIPQKDLLPLTGYIHGGCSPIGQKKVFKTFVDISAKQYETFFVSGGKRGLQIEINPKDLTKILDVTFVDLLAK